MPYSKIVVYVFRPMSLKLLREQLVVTWRSLASLVNFKPSFRTEFVVYLAAKVFISSIIIIDSEALL